jgi:hypothetical protein
MREPEKEYLLVIAAGSDRYWDYFMSRMRAEDYCSGSGHRSGEMSVPHWRTMTLHPGMHMLS